MNTKPSPSRYRNCISRRSTMARPTLTPALNVRSTTAPVLTFRSFVRTNAPPLPGFTCWNSITWNRVPSSSSVIPFFRSLVETLTSLLGWWAGMRSARPSLGPGGTSHHAGMRSLPDRGSGRRPSTVTSTMSSIRTPPTPGRYTPGSTVTTAPAGSASSLPRRRRGPSWISRPTPWPRPWVKCSPRPAASITERRGIHLGSGGPHPYRVDACLVSRAHQVVDVTEPVRGLAERHGPGHVGVVPVHQSSEVHLHHVALRKRPAGRFVMRLGRVLPERHDRVERRTRRPGPAQLGLELERQLALAHTV